MIRFSTCKGSDFNENWFQESAYKLDILPWVSGINWINSIIYKHFSDFNPSRSEKILYYAGKDSDILLDALEVNNKFSIDKNIIIRGGGKPLELSYPKDKGNKYDIIIAANILGHLGGVDNFHEFIRQSYESLLAGGRAIFTFNFNLTSNDKTINGIDFYLPILKDIYNIASSLKETEVEINLRPGNTNWDDYNYEAGTAPTSPFIRTKFHDYINLPSVLVIDKVANRKIENKIFSKVKNLVNVFGNNVEMKSDKKSIYFLHIPKTAGTSTVKFIQKQYEPNEILAASIWTSLLTTFPKDIEQYKCTYGHFGYSFTNLFNDKDKFFVFTMLRDPVKRVFSHYNHMIRVKEGIHWLEKENGELYALDELILENKAQLFFNNVMTYQIAVSESIYSNIENVPVNQRHTARFENLLYKDIRSKPDEEVMALAKKNLDNLGFIGLQENFDESLLLLSYKMNWWPELQEERYMTSPKGEKKQEDIRTKELVKSVNEMDYEIYGYGKNIFVNEYQLMLDDLQKNYYKKSFNKLNELNQVLSMLKERYRQVNKK